MSRIIEFTLQSKGGVGKSFHTYFRALSVPDEHSLFVDVDSSTQTSTRQLKFLGADRLETISLLDNRDVLVRDTFLGYMESLAESSFEKIYMDFGAPESEQIPALIQRDIPFRPLPMIAPGHRSLTLPMAMALMIALRLQTPRHATCALC